MLGEGRSDRSRFVYSYTFLCVKRCARTTNLTAVFVRNAEAQSLGTLVSDLVLIKKRVLNTLLPWSTPGAIIAVVALGWLPHRRDPKVDIRPVDVAARDGNHPP